MIKSLSIIFPVFNEELRLKLSFNHIKSFIKKKRDFKTEIIFANDGSTDNSLNLINEFINSSKQQKKIKFKIVNLKRNLGKGGALKLSVIKADYQWVLTTDIDMSVSLFQVTDWLKKKLIKNNQFVYFGSRTHKKSLVKKKFLRNILGNIMRFIASTLLNIKIKDTQCGYKLYKKNVAKMVFSKLANYGFDHDLEIVLILHSKKISINELPVKWTHKSNSRLNILLDPIKMLIGIMKIRFRFFGF